MFHRRWIGLVIAALLVFGVFSAISSAGQQQAWMQGYLAGRLSTGSDGGAALAPYMMPGGAFGPHYGGVGPGLFIGLGLLAFGFFLVSRRFYSMRQGAGRGPDDWHEQFRREARRWHESHRAPWDDPASGGPDAGRGDEQRMV